MIRAFPVGDRFRATSSAISRIVIVLWIRIATVPVWRIVIRIIGPGKHGCPIGWLIS
jgi:hypothetical protein